MSFHYFDSSKKILQDASRIVKRLISPEQEGKLGIDWPPPWSELVLIGKVALKMFCKHFWKGLLFAGSVQL